MPPPENQRSAALLAQALADSARARARTARLLRAGGFEEVLIMAALASVAALLLIKAF